MTEEARIDEEGNLHLPARVIPLPPTISPEARQALSGSRLPKLTWPPLEDKAAWKAQIDERNGFFNELMGPVRAAFSGDRQRITLKSSSLYEIKAAGTPERDYAVLYFHGGAYVLGGGEQAADMALPLAMTAPCRVFSSDYRMPPDHPFPAAVDDTVDAYRYLLERYVPGKIGIVGLSAGAGLAAACILKSRDMGLPLPGAAVLLTPESDLTESGDSFETNRWIDGVLRERLRDSIALYADGHDLRDPYLSPAFGDFSRGFPPSLLITGTRDLFLSNTALLHRALRRAGCEADLHVFEAMPHGGFFGAPEDAEAMAEQIAFLERKLGAG